MELALSLLVGILLGWAIAREYTLREVAQQILLLEQKVQAAGEKARDRELSLIDRYLRREGSAPLEVQRENVLKVPDPETMRPRDFVEEALRLDEIKELAEGWNPDAAWMSAGEVEQQMPDLWKKARNQWEAERTPLRVG